MRSEFEIGAIMARLRSIRVRSERDELFLKHLNRLLAVEADGSRQGKPVLFGGESRGIAVIDGPGGGKTSLIRHKLENHPGLLSDEVDLPHRFIAATVPSPATLKSLGCEILRRSGYPEISERRERWSIWKLLSDRLQLLGVTVLWIDEAHDLFGSLGPETRDILKTIKSLMQGPHPVIVILSGIDDLEAVIRFDEQVDRRFTKIKLPKVSAATDRAGLISVLNGYCEIAGLAVPTDHDLPDRIMAASRYRFGRCFDTMLNAIELALRSGHTALDKQHFAEAYAMQQSLEGGQNVFLVPNWADLPTEDRSGLDRATRTKRKAS